MAAVSTYKDRPVCHERSAHTSGSQEHNRLEGNIIPHRLAPLANQQWNKAPLRVRSVVSRDTQAPSSWQWQDPVSRQYSKLKVREILEVDRAATADLTIDIVHAAILHDSMSYVPSDPVRSIDNGSRPIPTSKQGRLDVMLRGPTTKCSPIDLPELIKRHRSRSWQRTSWIAGGKQIVDNRYSVSAVLQRPGRINTFKTSRIGSKSACVVCGNST